ncbi:MAG: hypothetical protein IJN21_02245 [Clostridia bacterium]|nr:hypothetical protein [Clostridia bacterium]
MQRKLSKSKILTERLPSPSLGSPSGGAVTEGDKKCKTTHVTQDELEKAFASVMQKFTSEKEAIFAVCREVLDEVLDTSELDRIVTRLQNQALGMAERVRKLVKENSRVRRDQEEYQKEYDALAAEHEKHSEKIRSIEEKKGQD